MITEQDMEELRVMLARIETDLRHHIKRTELLEQEVRYWRQDLKPVQEHVVFVRNFGKFITVAAVVGTAIAAFIALK